MKKLLKWIGGIIIVIIFIIAARSTFFVSTSEIEDARYAEQCFEDGNYIADVYYTNKCTGFRNVYELIIEIEGDYLQRINFGNGGYLSSSQLIVDKLTGGEFTAENVDGCGEYEIVVKYQE